MTDREKQESYRLFIQAANRFSDQERTSAPVSFTVTVNDTNDNSPVFREPSETPVPLVLDVGEGLFPGTEVGFVNVAKDADGPGNDIIYYFIVAGNEGDWFFLNKFTGLLTLQKILNREEKATYTLIIKASSNETYLPDFINEALPSVLDPGTDPTLKEVVVEINDVNDNPPEFEDGPNGLFTAGVLDSFDVQQPVVRLTVSDADTDPANRKMTFSITNQQNCNPECTDLGNFAAFGIDSNDTMIYTIRKFQPSEQGYYQLDVHVVDPTKPEFSDVTLVDIYLITEKQQVRIDFGVPTDEVLAFNVEFRELYASIIEENPEYTNVAVNLDDIQVYTTLTEPVEVIDIWTYMIAHAVDLDTNRVIEASVVEAEVTYYSYPPVGGLLSTIDHA
ncbi:cadherin-23-like [Amphiura filiformis]|uniref:cadherin-23-like n=1 Tax=Amphiura filiformis TaxID=82378 RepID=UPI003B212C1A